MEPSFLLISCTVNKNIEVADELQKIHGIEEAIPVYGPYDCIVKTNLPSDEVMEMVSSTIRFLDNIHTVLPLYSSPPKSLITSNV